MSGGECGTLDLERAEGRFALVTRAGVVVSISPSAAARLEEVHLLSPGATPSRLPEDLWRELIRSRQNATIDWLTSSGPISFAHFVYDEAHILVIVDPPSADLSASAQIY